MLDSTIESRGYRLHDAQAPFVRHIGNLYEKRVAIAGGNPETWMAIRIEPHQTNVWGYAHATLISCLAEIAASAPAFQPEADPFLIVQMNLEFVHPAKLGDFVEGRGLIVEQTRSLCFTRAQGLVGEKTIFTASAIHKRVKVAQN